MNALPAGLLLPDSVLVAPWFGAFALFVAFNTVIYLGLTLAKFIPWPSQIHPSQVRSFLPDSLEDSPMSPHGRGRPGRVGDPLDRMRAAAAAETIPLALGLVGALTVIIGLVNTVLYLSQVGPTVLIGAAFGLVLIIVAQILARVQVSPEVMVWTWTALMLVLVSETAWRASVLDSAVVLAYAAITLTVIAPITLSWFAGLVGAVGGAIPVIIAGAEVSLVDTVSWALAATTAALASLVLLQLRLAGITRLAAEQARAQTLASTDPLTGVFSRVGLLALAPAVARNAEHARSEVGVVLCDVVHMTSLNDDYGYEYGDDVLAATARALRASLPEGTLIARWGGDGFLGLVSGPAPDAATARREIERALASSGVALGKRPLSVHVGCASGSPADVTLQDLVTQAARTVDDTTEGVASPEDADSAPPAPRA